MYRELLIAASLLIRSAAPLQIDTFVAPASAYCVTSTLIYGPTEAILVDAQYHISDAKSLADRITSHGRRLKAIVITHPDEDHYFGTAVLHQRFPDAAVYMTPTAQEHFRRTVDRFLLNSRKYNAAETPESIPTPTVLPGKLTIDGEPVEVIPDLQGDVLEQTNSVVWIPSIKTVIAGDIVFNGVHPWLADSNAESRKRWLAALERIASLHPAVVIAGHKRADGSDDPGVVTRMEQYLSDFNASRAGAADADALVASVKQKHPDWIIDRLLTLSAKAAFSKPVSQR